MACTISRSACATKELPLQVCCARAKNHACERMRKGYRNDLRYAHTLLHAPCYLFSAFPRSASHFLDTLSAVTSDPETVSVTKIFRNKFGGAAIITGRRQKRERLRGKRTTSVHSHVAPTGTFAAKPLAEIRMQNRGGGGTHMRCIMQQARSRFRATRGAKSATFLERFRAMIIPSHNIREGVAVRATSSSRSLIFRFRRQRGPASAATTVTLDRYWAAIDIPSPRFRDIQYAFHSPDLEISPFHLSPS
ncbi:hypothetical protein ALC62_13419 [Cyphomyrmex costatus]|uniref:Uncharacterized protein n=1 Tax=Cyphomyrmex costatus TaxID=456900 RepID=A0A195C721_9HYME|nr:hypothetical protein ALC62_13419 [Cyphomyrmex costatus]